MATPRDSESTKLAKDFSDCDLEEMVETMNVPSLQFRVCTIPRLISHLKPQTLAHHPYSPNSALKTARNKPETVYIQAIQGPDSPDSERSNQQTCTVGVDRKCQTCISSRRRQISNIVKHDGQCPIIYDPCCTYSHPSSLDLPFDTNKIEIITNSQNNKEFMP